ncbi:GNAT family N-acetyltransferase [Neiella sp. HB171785]|uniref:GNAT family N-acetyltransferase n=1 Tax=Neiella litorisoli TaxID=2771431 RepID=A0A8J6UH01_9GAMM|nr:GNAT family N-acetyltransferase [Neiella litorisoli]MBD1391036.1 GNAT family N-acetyltransferase [Neiella litorisoli]
MIALAFSPPCLYQRRNGFELTSDPSRIQFDWLHRQLAQQYWCENIPADILRTAITHSWCVSVFAEDARHQQVGFARLVTDYASFGYLADVYVAPSFRGKGIARWMVDAFVQCPELPQLQKWLLITADGHDIYKGVGFKPVAYPHAFMEIRGVSDYQEPR